MKQQFSFKGMLGCFLPSILTLVINFIVAEMAVFLLFCQMGHDYTSGSLEEFLQSYYEAASSTSFYGFELLLIGLVSLLVFGLWYYVAFVKPVPAEQVAAQPRFSDNILATIAGGALFIVGMQWLSTYLINAIATVYPSAMLYYEELMESAGLADDLSVILIIYAIVLAPIVEELTYRGLVLRYAKQGNSFWIANFIQALFFAVMHMNLIQGSYAFILGLALGYLVHKSGRLSYGIILHMSFNVFGTVLSSFVPWGENVMSTYIVVLGSLVAGYGGLMLMVKHIPQEG